MYVIKNELNHFDEKCTKIIQIILLKRSDPDPVHLFQIRIRPRHKVPDLKHCYGVRTTGSVVYMEGFTLMFNVRGVAYGTKFRAFQPYCRAQTAAHGRNNYKDTKS
jgi:hypothetical protein